MLDPEQQDRDPRPEINHGRRRDRGEWIIDPEPPPRPRIEVLLPTNIV